MSNYPCQWQQGLRDSEKPRDSVMHGEEIVWVSGFWLENGVRKGQRSKEVN